MSEEKKHRYRCCFTGHRPEKLNSNEAAIKVICPSYSMAAFQQRNEWMVDHSSRLIAIYNGSPGGTRNTIEYAKRKKLEIATYDPNAGTACTTIEDSESPCKSLFFSADVFKNTVTKP